MRRCSRFGKLLANLLWNHRLSQRSEIVFVAEHGPSRFNVGHVAIDQPCPMFPRVLVQALKEALPSLTEPDGSGEAFLLTQYQGEGSVLPQVVVDEPLSIGAVDRAPKDDEVGSVRFPLGLHPAIIAEGRAGQNLEGETAGHHSRDRVHRHLPGSFRIPGGPLP
jgi:hypothetical protein